MTTPPRHPDDEGADERAMHEKWWGKIQRQATACCYGCGTEDTASAMPNDIPPTEHFRRMGWRRNRIGRRWMWVCPVCIARNAQPREARP